MPKTKETCIYTDARLVPYEGSNQFKIGTSQCSGCGTRVDKETGEPVEGATCPLAARQDATINAETSQEALAAMQAAVDGKVKAALEEERTKLKAEHDAELNTAKAEVKAAKDERDVALAEMREKHSAEMRSVREDHESTLEEINKKHDAELKAAKAPPKP